MENTQAMVAGRRIVVVTGGSTGIGFAAARRWQQAGALPVLFARSETDLARAHNELGPDVITVAGDVTRLEDLDRLVSTVREAHGRIDCLFVNAGIAEFELAVDVTPAHFDRLFAVNVRGAFFTIQKALPLMGRGGAIVINTSVANAVGVARTGIYGATKAAMASLTRTLAAELIPLGIRVNAVSPGPTETPIHAKYAQTLSAEVMQEMGHATMSRLAIGRMAHADEVAAAVTFLASADAGFIVGQELRVDGGLSAL